MKPNNLLVTILAAGILSACGKKEDAPLPTPPPAAVNATNQIAPAATLNAGFEKLAGKWQRPDGGYIVEIRSVEPGGKMDAAYFNPKPIHVAKAEASQEGETVKAFIELRDVNYPGSTYTLVYDPATDQLKGIYYQAALRQQFEVFFERLK
jgi:uncharacterized protein (DUF2147 family)